MKKVTVLLSVYNGEKYLSEQIESIIKQSEVDVEILIRDDGSKDRSIDIINDAILRFPSKITFISGSNIGFAESFSALISYARNNIISDYYAFADQDDIWLEHKLARAIKQLETIEDLTIPCGYASNAILVNSRLERIGILRKNQISKVSKSRALINNIATGCTMVFNQRALILYNDYRPAHIKVHDYLMFLICLFCGSFIYDNDSYLLYRQHGNNQIGSKRILERFKYRFHSVGKSNGYYQNQTYEFLDSYKQFISTDDILVLSHLCNYNSSIFTRMDMAFSKDYSYNSLEYNIFRIIKVMGGKL